MNESVHLKDIRELLASDLSSYEISKGTGFSQPGLDRYRHGVSDLNNMSIKTALKLQNYYNEWKEMRDKNV